MRKLIKLFSACLLFLGLFMVNIYFPQNDGSVKVGFVVGGLFALVGVVRLLSAFRTRNFTRRNI